MRVRQDDRVHIGRANGKRMPVSLAKILQALKQSAIDEDTLAADLEEMFGTSDRPCRAEKCQCHAKYPTCPPVCQKRTVASGMKAPTLTRAMSPAIAFAV